MKRLLLLTALGLSSCAIKPNPTLHRKASAPVSKAEVIAAQSRGRIENARARLTSAREGVRQLRLHAPSTSKAAFDEVTLSLDAGENLLRQELSENLILTTSLRNAQDGLTQLLLEQEKLNTALEAAQRRTHAYWRLKLWLAALAATVAGWITWRALPPLLGPYQWWAILGAGSAVGTLLFTLL